MTQPDSQDTDQQTPAIGDNSGIHGARLQSFIDRVERLEEEKKGHTGRH